MPNNAFKRCRAFLGYHPLARWLSIFASIGAAFLYLALIALLGLFIDLLVEQGEIPAYHQLSTADRHRFLKDLPTPDDAEGMQAIKDELKSLGFDAQHVGKWAKGDPIEAWSPREPALLWLADTTRWLDASVSPAAAETVRAEVRAANRRYGVEATPHQAIGPCGLLSLVVRTRFTMHARWLAPLAVWNDWTWVRGNQEFLLGLFLAGVGIAIARLGLLYLSNYLGAVAVLEAVTRLRRSIYFQASRLGPLAFRTLGPSDAVSASTRHLEGVHDGLYHWLTVYFREPVKFALVLGFAFVIHFWLSLAFLLIAVLVWIVGGQIAAFFRRRGRRAEMRSADQLVLIQETLMLMRLIKVYLMEAFSQARLETQLSGYAKAQLARYRGEAIYRSFFFFLGLLAAMVLLFVAGNVILARQLGVTSSLVLASAIISLYWPVLTFLSARRIVRRSRAAAVALFDFLDRHGGVGQAIEAEFIGQMTTEIEFAQVSLREPGNGRKLLKNISLTIKAGERVAIVGPDEAEKHALVYLLPRFLDPTHGEVRIDGKNLRWVTLDSLRIQIAMILQPNLVFNDTVANNIGCGDPTYNLQRIIDAAKVAHVHQFVSKLPQGYETLIGELGHPLKQGEMFRIALARAILRDPTILVIEEPATPLDEDTKGLIDDTLKRFVGERTVIFLPHRLTTLRACDKIFLLYEGKLEAVGDHRELINASELYRHLQYMEFNEFAGLASPAAPAPTAEDSPA
ncbi:MAG: ABC transporter ATP-binding protein [Planctomycetes bacterium]|nr:ABC transporter ATP-binding protein [Planctomycetota bacterium]